MSSYRELLRKLHRSGRLVILVIEVVVIAIVTAMIGLTAYYVIRDLSDLVLAGSTEKIQLLVSDVFLLIILAEIIRSFLEAYRRPEMYLVGVTEVALVVVVREIVLSAIAGTAIDMLIASFSALVLTGALWILVTRVVRTRVHQSNLEE